MRDSHLARGLAVLSAVAAFSFGSIVGVAFAGHFHSHNLIDHGLVHGSSAFDGAYHGRTQSPWSGHWMDCGVGDYDRGWYHVTGLYGGGTCNLFSWNYSSITNECRGIAWSAVSGYLNGHVHDDHNPGGSCQTQRT